MTYVLNTQNIAIKRQGNKSLLFQDIHVKSGQSVLLQGPSGSGKTTLLSMLAGLLPPTSGQVFINGDDFYKMPSTARDNLRGLRFGFIFQTLHLISSLNVYNNIALAAKMVGHTLEPNRIENLLGSLGISDKMRCRPHELSHGERQRVAIARAVLNRPSILLADEPTSALDDKNAQTTLHLIKEQAKEHNATLIMATHDNRITSGFDSVITL